MIRSRLPAAHWSETPLARLIGPMQAFISRSEASGIVLLAVTLLALAIANSPLANAYTTLLDTHISIAIGPFIVEETILHWINDGLMAIFFFLVGLEIKREFLVGELANLRAAMLPIVAATGGVIVPALIYTAFNVGSSSLHGWGVPMATDIAFALGCLALLGSRIPFGVKVFLTAVAIVDDLIAVLVIALFYAGSINMQALAIGGVLLVLLVFANLIGIRNPLIYGLIGVVIWLAFLHSGVHATIAGVLIALTIPARNRIDAPTFLRRTHHILQQFENRDAPTTPMLTDEIHQSAVIELEEACEQVQAPLQKMEHTLNTWVALLIMPLFAFANAGVAFSFNALGVGSLPVLLGILCGLTIGKPIGIMSASWLAVRSGIAVLPQGVTWKHMFGVSILAGIGFTMSLFIASLAFSDAATLATAKIAIFSASLIAGSIGFMFLRSNQDQKETASVGR